MTPLVAQRGRVLVALAWRRSRIALPDRRRAGPRQRWDDVEARLRLARHPLGGHRELVRELLEPAAREHGLVVAIADARARVLDVAGDRDARAAAAQAGLRPGADWSEAAMGANGLGTAAALGAPVELIGAQHYAPGAAGLACWAVPVRGHDGAVIGVLDLSGPAALLTHDGGASGFELPLLRAAACAVEAQLAGGEPADDAGARRRRMAGPPDGSSAHGGVHAEPMDLLRWRVRGGAGGATRAAAETGTRVLAVLGRDEAEWSGGESPAGGRSGGARAVSMSERHSEIVLLLSWHGAGLSAEQLLTSLHESGGTTTAVRAEMRRLRLALSDAAGPAVSSAPYRFAEPVRLDAREVVDLLDAGRVAEALSAYVGPVLPESEAPGVREIRDEVASRVRAAALAQAAGPELLALARRREHLHDHELWSRCYQAFAPGSAQRAEATARLRRIEDEFGR